MDIFGYSIKRKEAARTETSFVPPTDEGALDTIRAGGYYGTYLDLDGAAKNESELIRRYREISMMADVDAAIDDIINESLANIEDEEPVTINVDNVKTSSAIKKTIAEEFTNLMEMMRFNDKAHEYFRRWYVDGRLYFHKVIDTSKPKQGLTDIRYVDPRKIRKIRNVLKDKDIKTGVEFVKGVEEFFLYNDKGIYSSPAIKIGTSTNGLKIAKDSICFVTSGLLDLDNNMVLSYLHKAIKPANQLRMMENALVIYRLARAPERRIFYIDVGNLPKLKAEQYLRDIMNRYRNKLVYDASTGEIRDDKKAMSMLEDFWLPRREGGKGTEITTLPGGQNLGEIADIEYFQRKLYESLYVPVSRLQQQSGLNLGRAAEINRDELKFTKFIAKLRRQFSQMFDDLLKTQLILKGVITEQDWKEISQHIEYKFASDAYYSESKDQELLRARIELLSQIAPFDGSYVSKQYIMKHVMRYSEEEIEEITKENEETAAISMDYSEPIEDPNQPGNILPKGSPVPKPDLPIKKNGNN